MSCQTFLKCTLSTLLFFFLFSSFPLLASYPPEITGNIEIGTKHFDFDFQEDSDLLEEEMDSYQYWKGFIRYQQRLKPYSYYYLRYEYQNREYTIRDRYTSEVHQVTGNLTYQPIDLFRYYLQLNYRYREYPHSTFTYQAFTPSLQLNYYPIDGTTLTGRYQVQRRLYTEREESDYDLHGLVLTFRQRINSSLTLNGRFRVDYKGPMAQDELGDLEKRFALGFRYVMR